MILSSIPFKPSSVFLLCALLLNCKAPVETDDRPNVILIITDDQGYGDIAAHGNDVIQTPNLDQLWTESVRLTDFHVDPTCSPTRSALMTGRYSTRTGVWHTIMGRSLMDTEEQTIAEVFQENGYKTGMLGKWHLGDNYPLRPQDQGFDDVVWHKGGGVGQGPDYWGNDYFDDTYWRGETPEAFEGYCTDVWFSEASRFVEENKEEPFFLYLSTNAPHGPFLVDEKYSKPYTDQGVPSPMDNFYGMITNIDENLGRLRSELDELGLAENTLLIFMSDNGTARGVARADAEGDWKGFNAGMRGTKGSEYDGGHRVPFLMHWPKGDLDQGRDVEQLGAHIDVLPTLVDMLGLENTAGNALDGTSLKEAIDGDQDVLKDRKIFVHSQRVENPKKWRKSTVMLEEWRLVNQHELYNINDDPGQEMDIARKNPDMVTELQAAYEVWWRSLRTDLEGYVRISLGNKAENPVELMSHDWHTDDGSVPWHQRHVQAGQISNGYWAIEVEKTGSYEVTLYRWPDQEDLAMGATNARLEIGGQQMEMTLLSEATEARFELDLKVGPMTLKTWLTNEAGEEYGAYFVKVESL